MSVELIICLVLFGSLLLGIPIFASLGIAAVAAIMVSGISFSIVPLDLLKMGSMFPLLAIPAFILAGVLMEKADMAGQIIETIQIVFGRITGGLGIITIVASMFFASLIGSGPATAAAMGAILIPAMHKAGYGKDYAAGVCAVGGTMGILIPPSNPMIVYGVIGNVSVTSLFIAGILPGIMLGFMLIGTAYIIARKRNYKGTGEPFNMKHFLKTAYKNKWSLFAPIVIIGGIYGGIFTPVEASVVAVLYAFLVGFFVTKKLRNKKLLWETLVFTVETSGMVLIVVAVTQLFARILVMEQVPQRLAEWSVSVSENPKIILLMIVGFLMILGMFIEELATMAAVTPILVPLAEQVGIDTVHLGVVMVMTNEVAMLTPPLGVVLFVLMKMSNLSLGQVARAVLPFLLTLIIATLIVVFFEDIALVLPRLMGYTG
ncbi:C4-dicarboxylate ABC transporter permease [Sporosarcina sp. P13]|uniref:TRAP transporter large permease n=1 Tax=Sporosarcina sp. P13 TaxID=2048263 RepID=UPI000C167A2A|nr:TRAP transporter large permease [Sporosarcina sp. P13]PIC63977.1 C4-dicarboxylate ABC transporter permease [Sporosarcina sp. P13]